MLLLPPVCTRPYIGLQSTLPIRNPCGSNIICAPFLRKYQRSGFQRQRLYIRHLPGIDKFLNGFRHPAYNSVLQKQLTHSVMQLFGNGYFFRQILFQQFNDGLSTSFAHRNSSKSSGYISITVSEPTGIDFGSFP